MTLTASARQIGVFRRDLLAWYDAGHRQLPWRATSDPWQILLSEFVLQQTRVEQGLPYYQKLVERYPAPSDLAGASMEEVLREWEGLGYYTRARNLHAAARMVHEEFDGRIPSDPAALRRLPGVGPYTAAAVSSIAFGERVPALDGNALRVYARLFAFPERVDRPSALRALAEAATPLLDPDRPGDSNQAVMELGARICTPMAPSCGECPIREECAGRREGDPTAYPRRPKAAPRPHYQEAAAVLSDRSGRLLLRRRPVGGLLGGLWEFPGGRPVRGGRIGAGRLQQVIRREIGVEVAAVRRIGEVRHGYSHFRVTVHAFSARLASGRPLRDPVRPIRWAAPGDLAEIPMPRVHRRIADELLDH